MCRVLSENSNKVCAYDSPALMALPNSRKRPRQYDQSAFAALTGVESSTFFERYWEQELLVSSNATRRLPDGLLTDLPCFSNLLEMLHVHSKLHSGAVLHFKDQHPTQEYASCAAAYLDGASIIVNHAEAMSSGVAALCKRLREEFPHAFANLYLTPPAAQAVDAHADDRDVLVIQLEGEKQWMVYDGPPPVAFPSHAEQVGKAGLPVPPVSLERGSKCDLARGDVLYVPRGFVHEAKTKDSAPSLHLTVALPSADWSWASLVGDAEAADHQRSDEAGLGNGIDRPKQSTSSRPGGGELVRSLRAVEATSRGPWFWRRSVPPTLASAAPPEVAMRLAFDVEEELGLEPQGVLRDLLLQRAALHNIRQDAAAASGAVALDASRAAKDIFASPTLLVRRRREDEPPHACSVAPPGGEAGFMAREEIADTLLATLARLNDTDWSSVAAFDDGPLLCAFSKACFAQVCMDGGLLLGMVPEAEPRQGRSSLRQVDGK